MKLTAEEIKEQKALYGSEAVNFFVRFMDARERWKRLPEFFIVQVIENSDDLPAYSNTRKGSDRAYKRKLQHVLANREAKISRRKKNRASMGERTNKEV